VSRWRPTLLGRRNIATGIGLSLSAEKTKLTRFVEGFQFLGFRVGARSVKMRDKSIERFKTRIMELTVRSHNLDAAVVEKINQTVRGVANYFATPWTHVGRQFRDLDQWLRMRVRAMKFKRKHRSDNDRMRTHHLSNLGLVFLRNFLQT